MKRWTKLLDDYKKWKKKEKMEYLVDKCAKCLLLKLCCSHKLGGLNDHLFE